MRPDENRPCPQALSERGVLHRIDGPRPLVLGHPETLFVLLSGQVEIFAAPMRDGEPAARRQFLFSVPPGALILPPPADAPADAGWMVVAATDTLLLRLNRAALREALAEGLSPGTLAGMLDPWLRGLLGALPVRVPPRDALQLEAGASARLPAGSSVRAASGVLWVAPEAESGGTVRLFGDSRVELPAGRPFPVSDRAWVEVQQEFGVRGVATAEWLAASPAWEEALDTLHRAALQHLKVQWEAARARESVLLKEKAEADRRAMRRSVAVLGGMAGAVRRGREEVLLGEEGQELLAALHVVGEAMDVRFVPPAASAGANRGANVLQEILRASGVRARRVALAGEWWKEENGPLLVYIADGDRPAAAIPSSPGRYVLHAPGQGKTVPIDRKVAESLREFGWTFYKPFPRTPLSLRDVFSLGLSNVPRRDILSVIVLGLAAGALGVATPVAAGILFGTIIPEADRSQLYYMTLILVACALATFTFSIAQAVAMLRIQVRMQATIQASVWDRLLSLPVPFFRAYSAGDLAHRALSIQSIGQLLSGATISTLLSALFSFYNLLLLFYYDGGLALVALGIIAVATALTAGLAYFQVRIQRELTSLEGKTASLVLQLLGGIAKLKAAAAETRAYFQWARLFRRLREVNYKGRINEIVVNLVNMMVPVFASVILFRAVAGPAGARISAGDFIAFSAAFNTFLGTMAATAGVTVTMLRLLPLYERARPILETLPEVDEARQDPGELKGEIEVSRLYFRYRPDGPLVLEDVSLHVKPGEFVALVGPSGSGKSSLLRCLLGFETWESGMVLYDGQPLDTLDVAAVRRQIGVVLQNGRLMAADIFTNICGASASYTLQDAWEAAEGAGLADDIRRMPMGMHTLINEGASTISGGQRQRLLIARAIVGKPRMIFFDEATSALDNLTQAIVSRTLERLQATRIVIAHRLSTVRNADRIYVMERGRIVQVGTYDELVAQEGLFAELVKRQLA